MSEEQQYQGDRWTTQSLNILTQLGWNQIGDANIDIPCTNRSAHKTGKTNRKNPHGVDLLFSYFDPYRNKDMGIIVESKHRKWSGINNTTLQEFVNQVFMTTECADLDSELKQIGSNSVDNGLLMIWCNEPDLFDDKEFRTYLSNIKIKTRKKPITLHVAGNTEILKWCSILEKQKELSRYYNDFAFFYPSDFFSGGQSMPDRKKHVTLIQLFSKYIFAKSTLVESNSSGTNNLRIHHVFFFAKPTKDELDFLFTCIKKFQFEDADRLVIHFYGEQTKYRKHIEMFIREKNKKSIEKKHYLRIEADYLNVLKDVPENYSILRGN